MGVDFVPFLAALAVLPRSIWKNRRNSTVSSKPNEAKRYRGKELNKICPPNRRDNLCLGIYPPPMGPCPRLRGPPPLRSARMRTRLIFCDIKLLIVFRSMSPVAGPSAGKKRKNEDNEFKFRDSKKRKRKTKRRYDTRIMSLPSNLPTWVRILPGSTVVLITCKQLRTNKN